MLLQYGYLQLAIFSLPCPRWTLSHLSSPACAVLRPRSRKYHSAPHGLINYIDTTTKCRHLKNWPVKWLCGRCLSEFIGWSGFFDPALWTVFPLISSLVQLSPPPPYSLPVWNKYTLYTVRTYRPQTDKHLLKSPFTGQYLEDDILLWGLFSELVNGAPFPVQHLNVLGQSWRLPTKIYTCLEYFLTKNIKGS